MHNVNYGGRYTTNYIDDVKPRQRPAKTLDQERTGLTNFRPFEELARNLHVDRQLPHKLRRRVEISYKTSAAAAIGVRHLQPSTFPYTYVAPLGAKDLDWQANKATYFNGAGEAINTARLITIHALRTVVMGIAKGVKRSAHMVALAGAMVTNIFRRKYAVDSGVYRMGKRHTPVYIKAMGLALFVIVGMLLLVTALRNPSNGSAQGSGGARNSSNTVKSAADNYGAPSKSGSSRTASTKAANGVQSPTAGPNSQTAAPTNAATQPGRGGGPKPSDNQILPGTNIPVTPSSTSVTAPVPSALPNPATVVPYDAVTVPPASVSLDGKPLVGTSGTTLTTN